jgi:hypothetical protein
MGRAQIAEGIICPCRHLATCHKKRKREIYPTIHHATDSNRAPPSPAASGMRQVSDPGHATAASSTSATSTLTPALQLPDVPVRRARTVPEHNVKADRAG